MRGSSVVLALYSLSVAAASAQETAELLARIEVKADLEAVERLQKSTHAEKDQQAAPADYVMPARQPAAQVVHVVIRG